MKFLRPLALGLVALIAFSGISRADTSFTQAVLNAPNDVSPAPGELLPIISAGKLNNVSIYALNHASVASFNNRAGDVTLTAGDLGPLLIFGCPAHQWASSLNIAGTFACSQPSFADLSGMVAPAQLPPATTTSLGAIEAIAPVIHEIVQYIDNTGLPHLVQLGFGDLSGSLTASQMPALTGDITSPAGSTATTIGANAVGNTKLAQASANTLKGNPTGAAANEQDVAMPSCSGATNALTWTPGSGIGCNTITTGGRTQLTGNLTQYISSSGTDTGNCENGASPCATPTYVYNYDQTNFDLRGYVITVQFNSSYSGLTGWSFYGKQMGSQGPQSFIFQGIPATPSSFTISSTTANTVLFQAFNGAEFTVSGLQLKATGANSFDIVVNAGIVSANAVWFDQTSAAYVATEGTLSEFFCTSSPSGLQFDVTGSTNIAFVAEGHSQQYLGCSLTVSGNPAYTTAFVQADLGGMIDATGATVTPSSASGPRYNASSNGIIFTGGSGGASFFPGSVAGTTSSGGYYQ